MHTDLDTAEETLRHSIASRAADVDSRIHAYREAVNQELARTNSGPARREILTSAIETLKWAHLMVAIERTAGASRLAEVNRVACFLDAQKNPFAGSGLPASKF